MVVGEDVKLHTMVIGTKIGSFVSSDSNSFVTDGAVSYTVPLYPGIFTTTTLSLDKPGTLYTLYIHNHNFVLIY